VTSESNGATTSATTHRIVPAPTDEEAAAIVAAVQVLWPRQELSEAEVRVREATWRFSGRWWAKPLPARRDRPYR
jgi:hypothetical protein